MALDLEQELGSGATGQYWRITRYTVDRADNTLRVALHLYKSRSARLDGKFPMLEKELVVPLTDSSHTIADVYTICKTAIYQTDPATGETSQVNPFVSATDVLEEPS